jgi:hypothetical protein
MSRYDECILFVMPGLDPGIHVFLEPEGKTWMAGTGPAMTQQHFAR